MMEEYLSSLEDTLADLTGERGLGAKLASDVADCFKLDLLDELNSVDNGAAEQEGSIARILDILSNRNIWNDVRVAWRGIAKLRCIQQARRLGMPFGQEHRSSFAREFVEAGGLTILMENGMKQHPLHVRIQKHSGIILQSIIENSLLPDGQGVELEDNTAVEITTCLVSIFRNHPNDLGAQQAAVLALAATSESEDRNPAIVTAICPAGGLPLLFGALHEFSVVFPGVMPRDDMDEEEAHIPQDGRDPPMLNAMMRIVKAANFLTAILQTDPGSGPFLHRYSLDSPDWMLPLRSLRASGVLMFNQLSASLCEAMIFRMKIELNVS